jgi:hypothetical protein
MSAPSEEAPRGQFVADACHQTMKMVLVTMLGVKSTLRDWCGTSPAGGDGEQFYVLQEDLEDIKRFCEDALQVIAKHKEHRPRARQLEEKAREERRLRDAHAERLRAKEKAKGNEGEKQ